MSNDIPDSVRVCIEAVLQGKRIRARFKRGGDFAGSHEGLSALRALTSPDNLRECDFEVEPDGVKGYLALMELPDGSRRLDGTVYLLRQAAEENALPNTLYPAGTKLVGVHYIELDPEGDLRGQKFTPVNAVKTEEQLA